MGVPALKGGGDRYHGCLENRLFRHQEQLTGRFLVHGGKDRVFVLVYAAFQQRTYGREQEVMRDGMRSLYPLKALGKHSGFLQR